jgi:hypothetical protein
LVAYSIAEQDLAKADLYEFLDVMFSMIFNPCETHRIYQEVIGLNDLQDFLSSGASSIRVLWNSLIFSARHDEFGAIVVTDLTMRK